MKVAAEPHCGCHNTTNQVLPPLGIGRGVPSGGATAWWAEKGTELGLWDGGQCPQRKGSLTQAPARHFDFPLVEQLRNCSDFEIRGDSGHMMGLAL